MLKRTNLAALLLVFLAVLPGLRVCAATTDSPLKQALELYRSGAPDRAVPLFKAAIAQDPEAPETWRAHLALARIYHQKGRLADMLAELGAIPADRRTPETRLLEGFGLIGTGQHASGVELLRNLTENDLNGSQQQQRLTALTEGLVHLERPMEALFFIQQLLQQTIDPPQVSSLLQKAHELLKDRCSDAQLAEAAFLYQGTALGQDALLLQAWRHKQAGRTDQALLLVNSVLNTPIDFPFRNDADLLLQQLSHGGETPALGVILPLSGRFGHYGKMVLQGMQLALEQHNLQHAPVHFLVRDSAGDPDLTAQLVTELAASPQILGILGPLTGSAAKRAAHTAERLQLPLLTLSQQTGLPQIGSWIFRNSLTSELQVRTLVNYAMYQQNMTSFGILAPETRLGQDLSTAFADEVRARGGQIVAVQSYQPQATDFREQIKRLQGKQPNEPETTPEDAEAQAAEPPPFDALFIPDTPNRLALIAPQLPFYGLDDISLLGSANWDAPNLLPQAGPYIENAVFVSGFHRYSAYPFVKDFVDRYFERYGAEPSLLEAQGYDVAGIALSLLANPTAHSRANLRRDLTQMRHYPGVTGASSFTTTGDADKVLYLLQIRQGALVELN
ncbi:penicillin-binding protein activator [Syntrophotalea carbinolica]|uniref:penicillin-binding protein activator n=1 Tax=Syntrophotalea carbinolica TaxID=19 RepID=UPI0002FFA345|nr:penicillin-binding protein activator [Syntrophotalea carbinolica]